MSATRSVLILFALAALCGALRADPQADATQLHEEALKILKANANRDGDPKEIAQCIFDLEKASGILEAAKDTDSELARVVNAELYWARKRSTLAIDAALDQLKGVKGGGGYVPPPPPKIEAPKPPAPKPEADEPPELAQAKVEQGRQASALKAFQEAQSFALGHAGDDYTVALQYFHVASQFPGTDISLKALELARQAQQRFAAKSAATPQEVLPDTPEMKLVKEGDALAASGNYTSSFTLYLSSINMKETVVAHRRLGHAYFNRAQQIKDELMPQFQPSWDAYVAAVKNAYVERRTMGGGSIRRFNRNDPAYLEALAHHKELLKKANVAFDFYDKAKSEFKAVLRLAPKQKDLDAAGHIGLCMSQKADNNLRIQAKAWLKDFLSDYKPSNDIDRSVYEYCKTELDRISKA